MRILPPFRGLSGRLTFTVRRHKFDTDLSPYATPWAAEGLLGPSAHVSPTISAEQPCVPTHGNPSSCMICVLSVCPPPLPPPPLLSLSTCTDGGWGRGRAGANRLRQDGHGHDSRRGTPPSGSSSSLFLPSLDLSDTKVYGP